jgi:hypothetical protein
LVDLLDVVPRIKCDLQPPHFLPLPGSFNVEDRNSWASLAKTVHDWLITHEDHLRATSKFIWGVQAFWIAYTAAFPSFPNGLWPVWNQAIDINGDFIQDWF